MLVHSKLYSRIIFILCWLLAFSLPFGEIYAPLFTVLLAIILVFHLSFSDLTQLLKANNIVLVLISYYLLHLFGCLYSSNSSKAIFDLQVKLPLLVLPTLILLSDFGKDTRWNSIMNAYVIGCLIACLFCLLIARTNYILDPFTHGDMDHQGRARINFFMSSRLSEFMHPSYFSMYLCLCILIVYSNLNIKNGVAVGMSTLLIVFFSVIIILLGSRAGLLAFALTLVGIFVNSYFRFKKPIASTIIIGAVALSGLTILHFVPVLQARNIEPAKILENMFSNSKEETKDERMQIWTEAIQLGKKNILTGVGTGDVRDELEIEYKNSGKPELSEHRYNAHNQFIQSFVALGLPGLLALSTLVCLTIIQAIRSRNFILMSFVLLISINMLFESVLEKQVGVMFCSFFLGMLLHKKNSETISS